MERSPQDEPVSDCRETCVSAGDDKRSPSKSFSRVIMSVRVSFQASVVSSQKGTVFENKVGLSLQCVPQRI